MCVKVGVCQQVHLPMCVHKEKMILNVWMYHFLPIRLKWGLSLNLELDWRPRNLSDSIVFLPHNAGVTGLQPYLAFHVNSGHLTWLFKLVQRTLLPTGCLLTLAFSPHPILTILCTIDIREKNARVNFSNFVLKTHFKGWRFRSLVIDLHRMNKQRLWFWYLINTENKNEWTPSD